MSTYRRKKQRSGKTSTYVVGVNRPLYRNPAGQIVPPHFYQNSRTFRDPLDSWNELLVSAEDALGTSHKAEIGEIEAYDNDSNLVDLGNQTSYPSQITVVTTIPDADGKIWNLTGNVNRAKGGWRASAELNEVEF